MNYIDKINHIKTLSTEKDINTFLLSLKDDTTWLILLKMTYDSSINYWVKNIDIEYFNKRVSEVGTRIIIPLENLLTDLTKLSRREITGDAAYEYVIELMIYAREPELFPLILQRTFRMGVDVKSFNKAYGKDFILEIPYLRCGLWSPKTSKNIDFKYGACVQTKCDGMYIAKSVTEDSTFSTSRQGKEYNFHNVFDEEVFKLREYLKYDYTLTGEMLCLDEDKNIMPREKGNGLLQKASKGTGTKEEAESFIYIVWDLISLNEYSVERKSIVPYKTRFETLSKAISELGLTKIHLVETNIVNSYEEALNFYFEKVSEGEEGAILKDWSEGWKNGTSTKFLKLKILFDVTLRIVGFNFGEKGTWLEKYMGSLVCETEDGILQTAPGQWTEDLRIHIAENFEEYRGKLVEVTAHRITKDKKTNKPSLYLPKFSRWRDDINIADTFERVKEIEESVMMLKSIS